MRGTGDAGKCRSSPLGDLWLPTLGLNFKSIPDFAWRADMSSTRIAVGAQVSRTARWLAQRSLTCVSELFQSAPREPACRMSSFCPAARRSATRLQIYSTTGISTATSPFYRISLFFFRHLRRSFKEIRFCLTSPAATSMFLFGLWLLAFTWSFLSSVSARGCRAACSLQFMGRSLPCQCREKERRRGLSR